MKKTTSPQQIEANRRNAGKSTGPRTAAGKAASRLNATKHGLLAKSVVVRGYKFKESSAEFEELNREFHEHLAPAGPLEEMLVDKIVTTTWRLRRVTLAEAGEIALNVDTGYWNRKYQNPLVDRERWEAHGDPIYDMENSHLGGFIIERKLRQIRDAVEREGELTEAAIKLALFHGEPNSLTEGLEELRSELQQNPEGLEPSALRARQKTAALAYVDEKLHFISWHGPECENHEEKQEEARQVAAMLPPTEVLEKILRYETAMERQRHKAMNHLERLQRRRLGENVPPPMVMEVSGRL